jgi:hypothetical protein
MAKRQKNVTSANAIATMVVGDVWPSGFILQNWATDAFMEVADETLAETRIGIDGGMAAGYVPSIKIVTLSVESFSTSAQKIDFVAARARQEMAVFDVTLVVTIPALRQIWTYSGGVLKTLNPTPGLKKTIDVRKFVFEFESINVVDR